MKKRILACLLMMCMLVTMVPATAFAAEDVAPTDEPQHINEAVCICDALCTERNSQYRLSCLRRRSGLYRLHLHYRGTAQDEASAFRDALCTEEAVNADCPVCGVDGLCWLATIPPMSHRRMVILLLGRNDSGGTGGYSRPRTCGTGATFMRSAVPTRLRMQSPRH